ncbi:MAG: alpha/beta hydrolase family protein [Acidimicrobiales bacterium]
MRSSRFFVALLVVGLVVVPGTARADDPEVGGNSKGNHDLGCQVIEPTGGVEELSNLPVIAWSDGWYQGNVNGADTVTGYRPGLQKWADAGPYLVVAGTQWTARAKDSLRCLTWIQSDDSGYADVIDADRLGLAGHSQGAGAVIKAGDGKPGGKAKGPTLEIADDLHISGVVAMNPYGPSFGTPESIDGPVLFLGGDMDTTTPTSSYLDVWEIVKSNSGGVLAEFAGGTHNSEAWDNPADGLGNPEENDFGAFQAVSEQFWAAVLGDSPETMADIGLSLDDRWSMRDWSS